MFPKGNPELGRSNFALVTSHYIENIVLSLPCFQKAIDIFQIVPCIELPAFQ